MKYGRKSWKNNQIVKLHVNFYLRILKSFIVNTRSLTVHNPVEYVTLVKEMELDYLMMAFCKPGKFS